MFDTNSDRWWLLRLYYQYLKPYHSRIVTVFVGVALTALITAYIPVLTGRLFDLAIRGVAITRLLQVALLWLILSFTESSIDFFSTLGIGYTAIEASNRFEYDLIHKVIDLPVSYHREKKIGRMINRISRAVDSFSRLVSLFGFSVFQQTIRVSFALYFAWRVDWRVGGLILLTLGLYALGNVIGARRVVINRRRVNLAFERYGGQAFEAIAQAETVKAHAQESYEQNRLRRYLQGIMQNYSKRISLTWRQLEYFQDSLFSLAYLAVFFLAIFMVQRHAITPGQIITIVAYLAIVFRPFGRLADIAAQANEAQIAVLRMRELWDKESEFLNDGKIRRGLIRGRVQFDKVSFNYQNGRSVLDKVSFKIKAGEVIALVGESGVGKTTLVDLLTRFFEPIDGRILLDGEALANYEKHFLRSQIATVPRDISLFNDTIFNNIRYGRKDASSREVRTAAKAAYADGFIRKFPKKYQQLVGERGVKLSGGQRQRIAIARALLRDPKILILDEATASLDARSEQQVHQALQTLIKGRTTFIIAHRLSTVKQANKILVLHKGQIAESGTHEQLIAQGGIYQKLYGLQVENF